MCMKRPENEEPQRKTMRMQDEAGAACHKEQHPGIDPEGPLFDAEKFHDECGVVGLYAPGRKDIARGVYFGLHSLQH